MAEAAPSVTSLDAKVLQAVEAEDDEIARPGLSLRSLLSSRAEPMEWEDDGWDLAALDAAEQSALAHRPPLPLWFLCLEATNNKQLNRKIVQNSSCRRRTQQQPSLGDFI